MAKNFYDESESLVLDGLEAVVLSNPRLSIDKTQKSEDPRDKTESSGC